MGSKVERNGGITSEVLGPGWFSELNELWHGQAFSLKVKDVIHREKSKYQEILVLER